MPPSPLLAPSRTVNLFTLNLTFRGFVHTHIQIVCPPLPPLSAPHSRQLLAVSVFIVLNHRSKGKNSEKNGRTTRFIFSITSIVSPERTLPGPRQNRLVRLVARHTRPTAGCLEIDFPPPILSNQHSRPPMLCSGCFPVCSPQTLGLETFFFLLLRAIAAPLRFCFCCWPDFLQTKGMCACSQDFVVFFLASLM